MSVEEVRDQIRIFLKNKKSSVLCIRGNWGTGKTFNWDQALQEAVEEKYLHYDDYAYVSLFGINTLSEVKNAIIYENKKTTEIGKKFDHKDINAYVNHSYPGLVKLGNLVGRLLGDNYTSVGYSVLYMMVRGRLICIDDLERKGEDLRSGDILGLISQLRDERDCKIIILLNDEQLNDRDEFEGYLEKVVDYNLRFSPSPQESAIIALDSYKNNSVFAEFVGGLTANIGINNVRVIRKIAEYISQIEPLLVGYDREVFESVAKTIVLMGWCHFQPELAPSKQFIVQRKGVFSDLLANKDGKFSEKEQIWAQKIADFGYSHTDEFDLALLAGIEDGYFTKEIIDSHASELNKRVETNFASSVLHKIWRNFHDSFDNNIDEIMKDFDQCVRMYSQLYHLRDIISIVNLSRELGKRNEGDAIFDFFLDSREGTEVPFDLNDFDFLFGKLDNDILKKIELFNKRRIKTHIVDEMFLKLAQEGFNSEITHQLAETSVSEYIRVMKKYKGTDFRIIKSGLTQYNNLSNPSEFHLKIMQKTVKALTKISKESRLNHIRSSRWGVSEALSKFKGQGNT